MKAYIVSDHEGTSARVRQALLREGTDCPIGNVLSLDLAADHLAHAQPDLLVVTLSPRPERALAVLSQLRLQTTARIVVIGRAGDSQLVLQSLRGGATDFVDEGEPEVELHAALGRLRAERVGPEGHGLVIALLAPSGGSGSSTLAANIAVVLARDHQSALLIDLKLQTGDLATLLDLKPTHTLADLCVNAARLDRVMFERSLVKHSSGVQLLAPPRMLADVAHVTPEGVRQALVLGRALFPYVVVDIDHSFREEQVQVLRQADTVLLVLRLDFTSLRNAQRALDNLGQVGVEPKKVRVVINRHGQPKEVPASKAEEALGVPIFHYVPDDPKTINRSNNNGVPAVLEYPRARVCRSIWKLAQGINGQAPKH